jgi:release factor glutamine methyltransferase
VDQRWLLACGATEARGSGNDAEHRSKAGRFVTSVNALLAEAAQALAGDEARSDGELLLTHVLARSRAWLYAHGDDPIETEAVQTFRALLVRRAAGEPIAYLSGRREFWSLDLAVTRDVLIPRSETELLVELALQRIAPDAPADIVDLGTGSGAIALALARERPGALLVATDASATALAVARSNAARLGVHNIEFIQGDWCEPLGVRRFDMIVSNPPYIADADAHLAQGDVRFEPRAALASGTDGLDAIRAIAAGAPAHLQAGGWLLVEHGFDQSSPVRAVLEKSGFVEIFTARDLAGRERVTGGKA